jgi:outer membrane beta-barrel protein
MISRLRGDEMMVRTIRCRQPTSRFLTAAGLLVALSLAAAPASADERKSPLEGQPAVRHRKLLVKHRLELTPAFESSVNADYRHTLSGGVKAEYHISDMWSIGAVGLFGTSFNTGLASRVIDTLPDAPIDNDPQPTKTQYDEHLNSIPVHGAGYIGLTPWYGKLAAFGSLFVNFDFYFQGGVSYAMLKNDCCSFNVDPNPTGDPEMGVFPDNDPRNDDPLNDGPRIGVYLGGGIHVFMADWLALDMTVRDYAFADNPSGLDFDADLAVTDDDSRFLNHLFMGAGLSLFFPAHAKRSP